MIPAGFLPEAADKADCQAAGLRLSYHKIAEQAMKRVEDLKKELKVEKNLKISNKSKGRKSV